MIAVVKRLHSLYAERENQKHWYTKGEIADVLVKHMANNPEAVCGEFWLPKTRKGYVYPKGQIDTIADKVVFSMPGIYYSQSWERSPDDVKIFLSRIKQTDPALAPRLILIPLISRQNQDTLLAIRPDKSDANKADIFYINPHGIGTSCQHDDDRFVEAALSVYPQSMHIIQNVTPLQTDPFSSGPLIVASMIRLADANTGPMILSSMINHSESGESILLADGLPFQAQVSSIRLTHGMMFEGLDASNFRDGCMCDDAVQKFREWQARTIPRGGNSRA